MIDAARRQRVIGQALFLFFFGAVLFWRLVPLAPGQVIWPGPDFTLCLVLIWVLRRPEQIPVLTVALVAWGVANPASLGDVASNALSWTMHNLGWLFVIAATVFTVFVLVVALGRFGRIPLGKDDELPQFNTKITISLYS